MVLEKKRVILTKNDLEKRYWNGNIGGCFCHSNENIHLFFFECHVARSVLNSVSICFSMQPHTSVSNMFGSWLQSFSWRLRKQINSSWDSGSLLGYPK